MAKKALDVPTPSVEDIAKKWKLNIPTVKKAIRSGKKVEKEHTTDTKKAAEIARDHLGERPDYYKKLDKLEKSKIAKEETEMDTNDLKESSTKLLKRYGRKAKESSELLRKRAKRIAYDHTGQPRPEGSVEDKASRKLYRKARIRDWYQDLAKNKTGEISRKPAGGLSLKMKSDNKRHIPVRVKATSEGIEEAMHLHLKKNALHHDLGIPEGEKIPQDRLQDALHSSSAKIRKRAQFAVNASHWHHGKKKEVNEVSADLMHRYNEKALKGIKMFSKDPKQQRTNDKRFKGITLSLNKVIGNEFGGRKVHRVNVPATFKEERLEELTTKFLKRYTKAAHKKWDTMSDEERKSRKGHNMVKGVDIANRHIDKGGHIRETSNELKSRYIGKAASRLFRHAYAAGNALGKDKDEEELHLRRAGNRTAGIQRASRLMKEEETTMDNDKVKGLIRESIDNIQTKKLTKLQETFNAAIALKVADRLEEAKADIAKTYFAK